MRHVGLFTWLPFTLYLVLKSWQRCLFFHCRADSKNLLFNPFHKFSKESTLSCAAQVARKSSMAHSLSLVSTSHLNFGSIPQTRIARSSPLFLQIRAVQESGAPRRLVDIIRIVPEISRNYFKSPSRRALFGGISLLGGFYVAQTISLSFGALGVNDVIAAVVCVLLTEYVTRFYYSQPKVTFPLALLNNFKMGFTYGLFIDAFKLAS